MFKKLFLFGTFIFLAFAIKIQAQEFAPVGTAVAQFLEVGMGAKSAAMGEAYTTMAKGAGSVFWNPAGLVDMGKRNFYLAYNSWPADISISGIAFAINLKNFGTVAISSILLNTGDMLITTVEDPEGLSGQKFSIVNYAAGISYARFLTDHLSVGATAKLIHEKYFDYGYNSWALDLGTIYRTGFHGLKIGMSILHFGKDIRFSGSYYDYSDPKLAPGEKKSFETYSLPINFRVGFSIDAWQSGKNKLVTAADMVHSNNNLEQYNWGIEYSFNDLFFFRSGYKFRMDEGGFSLGAGIKYNLSNTLNAELNYSFSEMGVLPPIHRLSAGFTF